MVEWIANSSMQPNRIVPFVRQKAAADANAVQDAMNLVAVVGCFTAICPPCVEVASAVTPHQPSGLARLREQAEQPVPDDVEREVAASASSSARRGEAVEYEVVPL